jgi:hypothetical protein
MRSRTERKPAGGETHPEGSGGTVVRTDPPLRGLLREKPEPASRTAASAAGNGVGTGTGNGRFGGRERRRRFREPGVTPTARSRCDGSDRVTGSDRRTVSAADRGNPVGAAGTTRGLARRG